ncbi:MAG: hypothetical protein MHPSP_001566 [Paramarteilia canceri]
MASTSANLLDLDLALRDLGHASVNNRNDLQSINNPNLNFYQYKDGIVNTEIGEVLLDNHIFWENEISLSTLNNPNLTSPEEYLANSTNMSYLNNYFNIGSDIHAVKDSNSDINNKQNNQFNWYSNEFLPQPEQACDVSKILNSNLSNNKSEINSDKIKRKSRNRKNRKTKMMNSRWLGEKATQILEEWYNKHIEHPYPTKEDRKELMKKTNLAQYRISAWFSNKRNRNNNTIPKNRMKLFHERVRGLLLQIEESINTINLAPNNFENENISMIKSSLDCFNKNSQGLLKMMHFLNDDHEFESCHRSTVEGKKSSKKPELIAPYDISSLICIPMDGMKSNECNNSGGFLDFLCCSESPETTTSSLEL